MPTSNLALAPWVLHLVNLAAASVRIQRSSAADPIRLLDVGPGHGKYGVLIPEYVAGPWELGCIEAEQRYVTPRLSATYRTLLTGNVLDLSSWREWDIVLMVDVIEHLEKQPALDMLDRIPGHVVICTPVEWFQNPEAAEYPSERHRSLWRPSDFPQHRVRNISEQLGGHLVWLDAQP